MRCESANIEPDNTDRSCGFLTKSERELLLDSSAYDDQARRMKKHDIRVRTRHALADFLLLHEHAPQDLKKDIIIKDEDIPAFRDTALEHIGEGMMAFAIDAIAGEEPRGSIEYVYGDHQDV